MRDPKWVPPHVREQQFLKSTRRTATILLCLAVGVPFTLIAWQRGSMTLVALIPILLLAIGAIIVRSGTVNNREYVNGFLADLNKSRSKPPSA